MNIRQFILEELESFLNKDNDSGSDEQLQSDLNEIESIIIKLEKNGANEIAERLKKIKGDLQELALKIGE